ncbi:MAG: DUF983 domain-containing protein [Chthoniobacterales bacterium]
MRRASQYFCRATMLRCPICGASPIFVPVSKIRRLSDWFMPLDGCPRCGYAYDREPGYFLLSIWAINYGVGSLIGLVLYLTLEILLDLPLTTLLAWVLAPVLVFNLLFARHSKAYFIAFDHWWDPHRKDGGDGRGNKPLAPPPPAPATPKVSDPPVPETDLAGTR